MSVGPLAAIQQIVHRRPPKRLPSMVQAATPSSGRPDVAIFIPSYAGGGAERVAFFVARHLADAGLRVDLVVARSVGTLRNEPLPGVRKVELGALNEFLAAPRWLRYLKRAQPRCALSMIHTANFISGIGARLVPEVPVIVGLHYALQSEPVAQWWFRRWFGLAPERFLYKRAARIAGVSQGLADEAVEVFGVPPSHALAIPNPWSAWEGCLEIAAEHDAFFERPVVLGIGRLTPQKHFGMLVRAFAEVAASRPLNLVILGEGPERQSLLQEAAELGLADRVFLPGFVPNPQAYLRRARVFALSSRNEGFCMALIEAMEAGTAIVSTDCPFGPSEVIGGGRFGRLVPVGDVSELASALAGELDAPDVGHDARREVRAEWMQQFDPDLVAERYLALVREVIEESRS